MSVALYMDVHVRGAVTRQLRLRGVDVITAQEEGAATLPDAVLLERATEAGRILVSQDDDLLAEARARQRAGTEFAGLVYAHQLDITVGQLVRDLALIANAGEPEDFRNQVVYLPL